MQLMEAICDESTKQASITTETYATYIPGHDRTVVWQRLVVNGECIQDAIVGWYWGEPDDNATKQFSYNSTLAQYV